MATQTDIRYQGKCVVCGTKLGDWALKHPNPTCWDHRKFDLKTEVRPFSR